MSLESTQQKEERRIGINNPQHLNELFGNLDNNLKIILDHFDVNIIQRNDEIIIKGNDANIVESIITELLTIIESGNTLDTQKVNYVIKLKREGISYADNRMEKDIVCVTYKGKTIKPKTIGQKQYINALRKNDIVFGIGPAGTGKTYLAMAMAVNAFKNKEVSKIILTRPAVEAGERLGFLPGDLQDKVDPYLRPLYDALYDIWGQETVARYKERELIEIVPLAYMRGRTLDNSFIILDEAQNTTKEQMKMFLTRMGFGSKVVVTGDITQVDLPKGGDSGLKEAKKILEGINGISFSYLRDSDIVRHPLVQKIIKAYDKYSSKR
ncbi:MAG: PhoH family protein [Clostridia bacterium]|nr:PhoH family protein [Clostridia bacterium]